MDRRVSQEHLHRGADVGLCGDKIQDPLGPVTVPVTGWIIGGRPPPRITAFHRLKRAVVYPPVTTRFDALSFPLPAFFLFRRPPPLQRRTPKIYSGAPRAAAPKRHSQHLVPGYGIADSRFAVLSPNCPIRRPRRPRPSRIGPDQRRSRQFFQ